MVDSIPDEWNRSYNAGFVRGWNTCIHTDYAERNMRVGELLIEQNRLHKEIEDLKLVIKDTCQ